MLGVGNDLQLSDMFDFEATQTPAKLPTLVWRSGDRAA